MKLRQPDKCSDGNWEEQTGLPFKVGCGVGNTVLARRVEGYGQNPGARIRLSAVEYSRIIPGYSRVWASLFFNSEGIPGAQTSYTPRKLSSLKESRYKNSKACVLQQK